MNDVMAPVLADALAARATSSTCVPCSPRPFTWETKGHNRNKAGSLLFLKLLAPDVARVAEPDVAEEVLRSSATTPSACSTR